MSRTQNISLIKKSNEIKNRIQERFCGEKNGNIALTNGQLSLQYAIAPQFDQKVSNICNSKGVAYIEDTFDVFVKMEDGGVYYTSKNPNAANTNIFRFGYYYHDLHIEGQNFLNGMVVNSEYKIPLEVQKTNDLSDCISAPDLIKATLADTKDPYVALKSFSLDTKKYNYIQVTASTTMENSFITLFVVAGSQKGFNHRQNVKFNLTADGEMHTYTVFLNNIPDYSGEVTQVRLDFDGGQAGKSVEISDVRFLSAKEIGVSTLSASRIFHAYPDKLHHELQVVGHRETSGIEAIGVVTEIAASTVDAIVIKDACGVHNDLCSVDWDSVECVGFDIKNAGIYGYILPVHETTGKLTVTLDGDKYTVIQQRTPQNNTILTGNGDVGNANDFRMGQRIYTDESHSFDRLLEETACERAPLNEKNFSINNDSDNGAFIGYNALRGMYEFIVDGTGFNEAYRAKNKHYCLDLTVNSPDCDRLIYVSATTSSGSLECAALLDEDKLMLPVPIEVVKNFCGDGDANIYNLLDSTYSEAIFPLTLEAGNTEKYTVAHLYQNWGRFPLKQISSIQFYAPYYHISTGVTETNCIKYRYTNDNVLPDHRAMSAPQWSTQPQHTSGGFNSFITYNDGERHVNALNIANKVGSYGPVYADVTMDYLSSDGKMAVQYTHFELPQTDETRTYYTFEHTFLENMSFDNFSDQFSFYSLGDKDPAGDYQNIGYLDKDNKAVIVKAKPYGESALYTLGDDHPYFDYFDLIDYLGAPSNNYVNLGFILSDPEIVIGGKPASPRFAIKDRGGRLSLTLDLDSVTFKRGDYIKFNAVIMPWGSQESDYSGKESAPDQNIRDVRENTLLDAARVTPMASCKRENGVFLPSITTLNGKNAEFTVSGGENNVAVRAYGFIELGRPSVYENIDGEWVKYELSSKDTPDADGNRHDYDGYNVFYDVDGTYSYSFIVNMKGGKERKFRIEL